MFTNIMNNKNQIIIPLLITIIVFFPILLGYNFLLFSTDNLFGSLPGIQFSKTLQDFGGSTYFPFSLRGIDFSSSINNFSNSIFFKPLLFLPINITYSLIFFEIIICYFLIGYLSYRIIFNITNSKYPSIFGGSVVQLSSCTIFYLQTFPNIFLFTTFLATIFVIQNYDRNRLINNVILSFILLWTLVVTGHISYAFYFCFFIFIIFNYYFFQSNNKKKFFLTFFISVTFSILLSINKIIPIFIEIIEGGRIGADFVRTDFFSPLRFLVFYLNDVYGSSIYKMQYLGEASTSLGTRINPNNVLEMYMGHGAFVYVGIINIILVFYHIFLVRKFYLWKFISLFYLLFNIFPFFSNISNVIFFPFHHGSINYISAFFLSISASISLDHLVKNKDKINDFKNFFLTNTKIFFFIFIGTFFYIFVYVLSIQPKINFSDHSGNSFYFLVKYIFNLDVYFIKIYGIFLAFILFFLYFYLLHKKKFNIFTFAESLKVINVFILIFTLILMYFLTPIGRFCLSSFLVLFIFFWIYDSKKFHLIEKNSFRLIYYCFSIVLILFIFKYFLIDKIPVFYTNAEDYPDFNYYRIRNGFSNIIFWQFEWLLLIIFGILKVFYILSFINNKIHSNVESNKIFLIFFIIFIIDSFPAFLNKIFWISKPYVSFDFNKFEKSKKELGLKKDFDFRYNFVNKSIPVSNLNNSNWEGELISNFPYIYGIPSYGGVNSQMSKKFENFMISYVNNKNSLYGLSSNPSNFARNNFGIAANYDDERLLNLFGVKYDLSKNSKLKNTENLNTPLSRFMKYENYLVVKDELEAGKILSNLDFNINSFVVIENINIQKNNNLYQSKSKQLTYSHKDSFNKITVKTKNMCVNTCILLFNDNFNKHWKAFSENKEYKISPANGISMGIIVDDNPDEINFLFENDLFLKLDKFSNNILKIFLSFTSIYLIYWVLFRQKKLTN